MTRRRSQSRSQGKGGLRAKVFGKGLFGRQPEMGLFGVDAGILIVFFLALLGIVAWALSKGLSKIFLMLVEGLNFTPMLIHIPGIAGQPLFYETTTSGLGTLSPSGQPMGIFTVSTVMGHLYGTMQLIAFVGLIIVAIILGITYVSEQFNLVSRGTSFQFFSESALILVLLFIFPIIFNASAAAINALNQQVILSEGTAGPKEMVETVAEAAVTFEHPDWFGTIPVVGTPIAFGDVLMTLIQATASFTVIFSTFLAGVGRLLLIGMLAAAFPLILVLRLIPSLRRIATELQGALIGLMIGTVLASLIIRISWGVLTTGEMSILTTWAVGSGTLIAVVFMLFMMARGFGSLGGIITGTLGAGAAGVVGGTIAAGAGAGVGMVAGGAGAVATASGRAGGLGAIGRGVLAGGAAGTRGPVGAVLGAPGAGKEAAHEFSAGGLKAEMAKTASPIDDKLAEYQIGNKDYLNWRASIEGNEKLKDQYAAIGDRVWGKVNSGTMPLESHRRASGVLYGKPAHLFEHLEKQGNISRHDYEAGIKNWYNTVKKTDFISTPKGNIPAGEKEAKILLGYVFSKGAGKLPRLGEDVR